MNIDLKKEQEATLTRPVRAYGVLARLLFRAMDIFYGKELTLGKARLLEILARVPYQAWEIRQYHRMNTCFSEKPAVAEAEDIIGWGREAQDNEFWHLQVINEKIIQEGITLNWFKDIFVLPVAAFQYNIFSRFLALLDIQAAFRLNADFEDHAEHEYMSFVRKHPELDEQPAVSSLLKDHRALKTWGDVFRRIALDEREHMNNSLKRCGKEAEMVPLPPPVCAGKPVPV
ncbi:MAG: hypothetical protein Q7R35_01485 [Elusimicrobiota bacterium]|nr:hypothetical protein [Elusimicrobiota bacterium]